MQTLTGTESATRNKLYWS